jgi:hypothetical protein
VCVDFPLVKKSNAFYTHVAQTTTILKGAKIIIYIIILCCILFNVKSCNVMKIVDFTTFNIFFFFFLTLQSVKGKSGVLTTLLPTASVKRKKNKSRKICQELIFNAAQDVGKDQYDSADS